MISITWRWLALHAAPFFIVIICMNTIGNAIGLNAAAMVTVIAVVAVLAFGTPHILAPIIGTSPRRLRWFTAGGIALGLIAGLVVMSTIDLAGFDTAATYSGMAAAGIVIGISQALGFRSRRALWIAAVIAGWIPGAALLRAIAVHASTWSVLGVKPLAAIYDGGHNELLWSSIGIAAQGVTTLFALAYCVRPSE